MPPTASKQPKRPPRRPLFKPAVILHGGAGNIQRSRLPPELYSQYHASLLTYLRSTTALLNAGLEDTSTCGISNNDAVENDPHISSASALNAAVHAVSLMEDDELFNCGRGSVFTLAGTIEMEASVMVASLVDEASDVNSVGGGGDGSGILSGQNLGSIKRGAGVMLIRNVKHPIQLAREVLLRTGCASDGDNGDDGGSMHSQLSGEYVEGLAKDWGLEFCPDDWFWTKKRWEEHKRGLEKGKTKGWRTGGGEMGIVGAEGGNEGDGSSLYLSQGTVGCVCLDRWGNVAVATSTGGLTNKCPGRIGDTPTLGAGFWAEAWDVEAIEEGAANHYNVGDGSQRDTQSKRQMIYQGQDATPMPLVSASISTTMLPASSGFPWPIDLNIFRDCFSPPPQSPAYTSLPISRFLNEKAPISDAPFTTYRDNSPCYRKLNHRRRILALSGTGNGDSFLRTAAARTAAAMARFSPSEKPVSLAHAITAVAGPGGELQRSAGKRWGKTGEGEGGIIGIEAELNIDGDEQGVDRECLQRAKVVFDFNCEGMFRAWMENKGGQDVERVMVFRNEYE
ncbi:L-asparaginase [Paracoccidioides lutzii Pb01]|uniref:L-asparaginase n=1 Tax=Paracoccidioides lutzii (strain ATCC MYA-826 / Pb01) TaxID=502779 RepID=C1GRR1_PARBA|nr:L-asparaginase [Paracoccidioides lutzii Pb01]EEH38285.2 L-asparaginase [Paracoccidioides lutzii Pb01]